MKPPNNGHIQDPSFCPLSERLFSFRVYNIKVLSFVERFVLFQRSFIKGSTCIHIYIYIIIFLNISLDIYIMIISKT